MIAMCPTRRLHGLKVLNTCRYCQCMLIVSSVESRSGKVLLCRVPSQPKTLHFFTVPFYTRALLERVDTVPLACSSLSDAQVGHAALEPHGDTTPRSAMLPWDRMGTPRPGQPCCTGTAWGHQLVISPLKMGSYSSIMMCQYWDNCLIYRAVY